jgi:rfaE bifunctional protein kinase chain/domain
MIPSMPIQSILPRGACVKLLDALKTTRIGVLGDFTLDGYWYADMTRSQLSRETPLFPRPVARETYSNGGAANVAWNLCDLGLGEVHAFTVLGADWRGQLLRQSLAAAGVRMDSVVTAADWLTPFFGKVILTSGEIQQEDSRLDFINTRPLPEEALAALLQAVERLLPGLNGLVLADYQAEGVLAGRAAGAVSQLASRHAGKVCIVDSRDRIASFPGMVLKPNDLEAARLLLPGRSPAEVSLDELAGAGLERQRGLRLPLFITLGGRGCLVIAGGSAAHVPGVTVPPPLDTVGAGDTFLAAAAGGLAAGASALEAACLANMAAAVTVRKLHVTGTASPQEILDLYESFLRT